jgi:hypothetical protein
MWRTAAILLLTGLLVASVAANAVQLQSSLTASAQLQALRTRAADAEHAAATLQPRVATLTAQNQPAGVALTPRPAATPAPAATAPAASPTSPVAAGPAASTLAPTPASIDAQLQGVEKQVAGLRGLNPLTPVTIKLVDPASMHQYLLDSFNADYLPSDRESDQKLYTTLGLLQPSQSLVQIELNVLDEPSLGLYDADQKVLYVVGTQGALLDPDTLDTFAHEYARALQDQHYDLLKLNPKHAANSDRSSAINALIEGDASVIQALWARQFLTPQQQQSLGQSADGSKLQQAPDWVQADLLFPYVQGLNFAAAAIQQGNGYAGVNAAFQDPPASTAQILHPEKYFSHVQPVDVQLPDLSGTLGTGWRSVDSNVLGELDVLNMLAAYTDRTTATQAAAGWAGDRWELLENNGQDALVLRTSWDSAADTVAFFKAESTALQARYKGVTVDASTATRQALSAAGTAMDVRIVGQDVLIILSFDRASADAMAAAVVGF